MRQNRIWVLGAPDPEMELIERLLRECGEEIVYATDADGRRVHPGNAYRCPVPSVPAGAAVYAVECIDVLPEGWVRIDHHRPGDPGYGLPPKEFLPASSIGQVLDELARLGVAARIDETGAHPVIPGAGPGYPIWGEAPGVRHIRHAPDGGGGFAWYEWCYVAKLPPRPPRDAVGAALIAKHPVNCACRYCVGGEYAFRIPTEVVFAAAADHCLAAAYRGQCPGVDPTALMVWRVEARAAFQGRSPEDIFEDIERARKALREAPRVDLGAGMEVRDMRTAYTVRTVLVVPFAAGATVDSAGVGDSTFITFGPRAEGTWYEGGHNVFVRRGVAELPEAAAREGVAYLATVTDRDGRTKVVLGGRTTPETVRACMTEWAPARGLMDIYGDPARGFAGGYLSHVEEAATA